MAVAITIIDIAAELIVAEMGDTAPYSMLYGMRQKTQDSILIFHESK
jgi:hypothetical protein